LVGIYIKKYPLPPFGTSLRGADFSFFRGYRESWVQTPAEESSVFLRSEVVITFDFDASKTFFFCCPFPFLYLRTAARGRGIRKKIGTFFFLLLTKMTDCFFFFFFFFFFFSVEFHLALLLSNPPQPGGDFVQRPRHCWEQPPADEPRGEADVRAAPAAGAPDVAGHGPVLAGCR
jgi:hypothetical protein